MSQTEEEALDLTLGGGKAKCLAALQSSPIPSEPMTNESQSTLDRFVPESELRVGAVFQTDARGHILHPRIVPNKLRAWPFQVKIANRALQEDLLVVLPTGLGKTVIAALVAAEVTRRDPAGKVLVLAPTRPLVVQHAKSFRGWFSSLPHAVFTGEAAAPKREGGWGTARAVFATPQVVLADVLNGAYSLKDVDLLVFDEAHHTRGKYAYGKLAAIYRTQRPGGGRILALTASPGDPRELVRRLTLAGAEMLDRADPEVSEYVKTIDHQVVSIPLTPEMSEVCRKLTEAAREEMVKVQRYGFLRKKKLAVTSVKDLVDARKEVFARPGGMGRRIQALSRIGMAQHLLHAVELLEREGARPFCLYTERLAKESKKRIDQRFLALPVVQEALATARGIEEGEGQASHPKLDHLIALVREEMQRSTTPKVLVFTEYRNSVQTIVAHLRQEGIVAQSFVGQASHGEDDPGMSQREQVDRVEAFRQGRFPVLVASRVAEEGLDIPQVDLVVEYDVLPSAMRTIQRHGRTGRTMAGRVVSLVTEGTKEERYRARAARGMARARRAIRSLNTR